MRKCNAGLAAMRAAQKSALDELLARQEGLDKVSAFSLNSGTLPYPGLEKEIGGRTIDLLRGCVRHAVKRRKLRGGYSEIIASGWLLENGYEVFRNVVDKGEIDMIALRGADVRLIDVKTAMLKPRAGGGWNAITPSLTSAQVKMGIVPLYVTDEGICAWSNRELSEKINAE